MINLTTKQELMRQTISLIVGNYHIGNISSVIDDAAKIVDAILGHDEQVCAAPQDPDHELAGAEVEQLAETGSLCDCMEVMQVFDECPIQEGDEFDFGSAVYLLKTGKKVARAGWNGKGMFVYYVPAASYPAQRNTKGVLVGDYPEDMVPYAAYLALKTASGEVVPWTVSQSDALATDWMLYDADK